MWLESLGTTAIPSRPAELVERQEIRHDVRNPPGRRPKRELGEPGEDLPVSIGWNRNPAAAGIIGNLAICRATIRSSAFRRAPSVADMSRPAP